MVSNWLDRVPIQPAETHWQVITTAWDWRARVGLPRSYFSCELGPAIPTSVRIFYQGTLLTHIFAHVLCLPNSDYSPVIITT